jgi:hypothetical protein
MVAWLLTVSRRTYPLISRKEFLRKILFVFAGGAVAYATPLVAAVKYDSFFIASFIPLQILVQRILVLADGGFQNGLQTIILNKKFGFSVWTLISLYAFVCLFVLILVLFSINYWSLTSVSAILNPGLVVYFYAVWLSNLTVKFTDFHSNKAFLEIIKICVRITPLILLLLDFGITFAFASVSVYCVVLLGYALYKSRFKKIITIFKAYFPRLFYVAKNIYPIQMVCSLIVITIWNLIIDNFNENDLFIITSAIYVANIFGFLNNGLMPFKLRAIKLMNINPFILYLVDLLSISLLFLLLYFGIEIFQIDSMQVGITAFSYFLILGTTLHQSSGSVLIYLLDAVIYYKSAAVITFLQLLFLVYFISATVEVSHIYIYFVATPMLGFMLDIFMQRRLKSK